MLKNTIRLALGGIALAAMPLAAQASDHGHGVHWSYEGAGAPAHWGDLKSEYALCKGGKSQSPIDISGAQSGDLEAISFDYANATAEEMVNNGHTIKVSFEPGSSMSINGKQYNLLQFHFHSPSEHTIDGQAADMVAHLVHKADDGQLGVVGVMLNKGEANAVLAPLWEQMPKHKGDEVYFEGDEAKVDLSGFLPENAAYYNYSGSLTTPPCSEGVNWLVLQNPVSVSAEQVAAFTTLFAKSTRPVQPLNGRTINASH